jgi:proline iminopeptidase
MFRIFLALLSIIYSSGSFAIIAEEKYVEVNNAALFCTRLGEGAPLMVLHGGCGLSQNYLRPQMDALANSFSLLFYDQRAGGKSTGEISPATINTATYVSDLDAVRKAYGYEKISLLGHSFGAFVAIHYALAHPDKVDKLILSNSMPISSTLFSEFLEELSKRMGTEMALVEKLQTTPGFQTGDPETYKEYYTLYFKHYLFNPEKVKELNLQMSPQAALNSVKILEVGAQTLFGKPYDLTDSLKTLKVPALVIHGREDVIPYSTAEQIYHALPHAEWFLIPQCGHFPYIETPETYFAKIREFLRIGSID